mmetsp:Transcript_78630/g.238522  ORF Transcript_78630/g.238522 Transcript_78630/m.238522 type:complete len:247 (+) Transcript_78630:108-848(+)
MRAPRTCWARRGPGLAALPGAGRHSATSAWGPSRNCPCPTRCRGPPSETSSEVQRRAARRGLPPGSWCRCKSFRRCGWPCRRRASSAPRSSCLTWRRSSRRCRSPCRRRASSPPRRSRPARPRRRARARGWPAPCRRRRSWTPGRWRARTSTARPSCATATRSTTSKAARGWPRKPSRSCVDFCGMRGRMPAGTSQHRSCGRPSRRRRKGRGCRSRLRRRGRCRGPWLIIAAWRKPSSLACSRACC